MSAAECIVNQFDETELAQILPDAEPLRAAATPAHSFEKHSGL